LLGGGEDCCAYSKELESSGGCVCDQPIAGIRGMKRIKTAFRISSNAFLPTRIEDNQHPVGCMPTKNSFPSSFLKSNCAARKLAEETTNRCGDKVIGAILAGPSEVMNHFGRKGSPQGV